MPQAICRLCFLTFAFLATAGPSPAQTSELDAGSPEHLISVLKANVYLTGDIVKRMAAQRRLVRLGRQDPQAVVPLILKELAPPRSYGKIAGHQRLALIELLRDLGAAAEASTFSLAEIVNDPEEPYEAVKTQAAAALSRIGTARARSQAQAYYDGLQRKSASNATRTEVNRSVEQSAYLIRQQLRSREPSDGVILASVRSLLALGPGAAPVLPTLLRAYSDRRLGSALHNTIGDTIRTAGVSDVEGAAAQAAERRGVPDILSDVIAETRHKEPFVRSLAMIELGQLSVSEPAIEALISALRDGRNPGDAARVLGDFGKPAARALPEIARYFDDDTAGPNAIQAAGKIGVKDPATISSLRRVLATPGHRHRGQSASALGKLDAADALPELQLALADGNKYDRILSVQALGRLGPTAAPAVKSLIATVNEPDIDLRTAAVGALGQIGAAAAPATAAISEQLDSSDTRLKQAAHEALTKIGGPQADLVLKQYARRFADADLAEIRRLAAVGGTEGMSAYLIQLPMRRADPLARRLITEEQPDRKFVGAMFLARQGDVDLVIPALADSLARLPGADKLFTVFIYSMIHAGNETQIQTLLNGLRRHIGDNRNGYTREERARLEDLVKLGVGQKRR